MPLDSRGMLATMYVNNRYSRCKKNKDEKIITIPNLLPIFCFGIQGHDKGCILCVDSGYDIECLILMWRLLNMIMLMLFGIPATLNCSLYLS